jgi:hypothetical protein
MPIHTPAARRPAGAKRGCPCKIFYYGTAKITIENKKYLQNRVFAAFSDFLKKPG